MAALVTAGRLGVHVDKVLPLADAARMRLRSWQWKDVRRRLTGPYGQWTRPAMDGVELLDIASVPATPIPIPEQQDPQSLGPA